MTRERRAAPDGMAEAEALCEELAAELRRTGIVLPSLMVDPVTYGYEPPRVLVELGRCNVETTRELIAVLKRAAQ
ncbi:hypothetical protein Sgleb_40050 [Streptomyces glebosus]|uniref:Uncharacterized protein n=1 Tax=Streptomyces glebosus TaxID=249580 RepID=A0A640SY48_9ACTN|nr:hypothetical protein [Streptomyces glebosus]GFE15958.1 hypothetical protein Sgleb_40050 [Streptomyces glebosus]GHG85682.1 hypothetical protein GCM10010513_66500 [Streptomyces glebosus]